MTSIEEWLEKWNALNTERERVTRLKTLARNEPNGPDYAKAYNTARAAEIAVLIQESALGAEAAQILRELPETERTA